MKNIKFIVKVNRGGDRTPEYVQRIEHLLGRRSTVSWPWSWGDTPPKTLQNPFKTRGAAWS
jgi:hypothetical protein